MPTDASGDPCQYGTPKYGIQTKDHIGDHIRVSEVVPDQQQAVDPWSAEYIDRWREPPRRGTSRVSKIDRQTKYVHERQKMHGAERYR